MHKHGIKCPKCGTTMVKKPNVKFTDPFEIGYYCPKCDTYYSWHNWQDYYESCDNEKNKKEKNKPKPFNPSVRGS